ncbi:MAG: DNA repair protein RecO [Planctomycetes bacterium]|nr:DNA repair protein RecO [Planctomycetota bacterium]
MLRTFEYGETSQILHLFTRGEGRVHGIAKGARRLKGTFKGGMDVLVAGRAKVYARRGSAELRVIGTFDVTDHFPGIRGRIARFHAAAHVGAILLAFTHEEQPLPHLYDLAVSALRLLESADDDAAGAVAVGFEAMTLRLLGFGPELGRCVVCEKPARNIVTARLSAARGGLLCSKCRSEDARAPILTGPQVVALRALCDGPLVRARDVAGEAPVRRAVRDALDKWSETFLDRPLRTARR